jgi:poly(3-hydroxybutyrate) depolymerase
MYSKVAASLLILLASAFPSARAALPDNAAGSPTSIASSVCGGRSSNCAVDLDVPSACTDGSCPIIFFLHGRGGTGEQRAWSGASDMCHAEGFICIFPTGESYDGRNGWNDGDEDSNTCAWDQFDCTSDPNDTQFFADIVAHLKSMGWTQGRVYFYGSSNGAGASQRAASNSGTDLPVAGIVAVITQLLEAPAQSGPTKDQSNPLNYNRPHAGSAQVAQLNIMGEVDPMIRYDGGSRFGSSVFTLASVPASNQAWAAHNGCSNPTQEPASTRVTAALGQDATPTVALRHTFTGCPATAPVEYYQVLGASHQGPAQLPIGQNTYSFVGAFFKAVEQAHTTGQWAWSVAEAPSDAAVYVPPAGPNTGSDSGSSGDGSDDSSGNGSDDVCSAACETEFANCVNLAGKTYAICSQELATSTTSPIRNHCTIGCAQTANMLALDDSSNDSDSDSNSNNSSSDSSSNDSSSDATDANCAVTPLPDACCTDDLYCNGSGEALQPSHSHNSSGACFCLCVSGFSGSRCENVEQTESVVDGGSRAALPAALALALPLLAAHASAA